MVAVPDGRPAALHAKVETSQSGAASDAETHSFGVRTVKTWLSAPGTKAYAGSRWFSVNGKPFVFRGGGMMDSDMFLRYSKTRLDHEVSLIKSMGLNGLRLEGDDQPDAFYDEMDKQGLLVYGGFLCCNYWENGSRWTAKDQETNYKTALTLGRQQRNHPSVIFYSWSDNTPTAAQEAGRHPGHQGRRLRHPADGVGGVQVDVDARPVGDEGGSRTTGSRRATPTA